MGKINSTYSDDFLHSFDYFWDVIIVPTITAAYDEIDQDFKDASNLCLAFNDKQVYKQILMTFYHEKRKWLKGVYLPHEEKPTLDMHKLGAILCRSILAHKPICFDFRKAEQFVINKFGTDKENHIEWFVNNIYVNYKIAFYVSCGLVYLNLLYNFSDEGLYPDREAMDFFLKLGGVIYYEKSSSHDSYEKSCIIALQKNDMLNRDFDYLAYAINLFQLESYNIMHYQLNNQN